MGFRPVPARLSLVDGSEEIVIRPAKPGADSPVLCKSWEVGAPAIREAVSDQIGSDGVNDGTVYTGAGSITLDLIIRDAPGESAYGLLERVAAMAHPSRRPYLYAARGAAGENWRIELRGNDFSLTYDRLAGARLAVQLVFSTPLGLWESPERDSTMLADNERGLGLVYPVTYPVSYGTAGATSPPATIVNGGSIPIAPILRLYGPTAATDDPEVRLSTGERFGFTNLFIDTGDYVEVNMSTGLVGVNGLADASRYSYINWAISSFWRVPPGTSTVAVTGANYLTAHWRDRRLTV